MKNAKVLIIRFSSFGDIIQCSPVVELLRRYNSTGPIHWVTRSEFKNLVALNKNIDHVFSIEKKAGILGLIKLAINLRNQNYTHIYDAHNNLRSNILKVFLLCRFNAPNCITRSKDRIKRLLLFYFRINKFPIPFKGIHSYLSPLEKWIPVESNDYINPQVLWNLENLNINFSVNKFITFVPSAAWSMKRWPLTHWKKLVHLLPEFKIVILGGKEDTFCEEIKQESPDRVVNLAGKISLIESCDIVNKSELIISADTGLLHVADVLAKSGVSLMGPTAFGFTTNPKIRTLELPLNCRPCTKDGRGQCSQDVYQKCMVEITPEMVAKDIKLRMLPEYD